MYKSIFESLRAKKRNSRNRKLGKAKLLPDNVSFEEEHSSDTSKMGGKLSSEVKEVLGKIKGEKHRAWIGVNEIHTSEFHEQDVIVIESVEADLSRKEILTHEVGDMVVIDTLELTMNDNVIDHNVTTGDDIEAKSLQHKHTLNDMNTLSSDTTNTTNSTSENEYFTTYDVAQDDDVGSLMYHTAYMDDVSDDDVLASKPSETWEGGFIVGEVLDTPASPEIGENSSDLNGDSPDQELASMQRDLPESPHLDRKYRKMSQELHETPIKYSSSVFKEGEIMIDYPPASSTPSHSSSSSGSVIRYDFQPEIPPRLFATALGRSPSSRSSSARSSVSVKTPKPSNYVTGDVILNTSPSSSRSSRRSSLDHHESVEVVIPSTSSNTHVKCDVTRSTSLGEDVVKIIDEMGRSQRRRFSKEEPAVLEVRSEHVEVRRPSLESIHSRAPSSGAASVILDPKLLRPASHDTDLESGVFPEPSRRPGSFKQIVRMADEYMMPIVVTSVLILIGIGGIVAMAIVFPST